MMSRIFPPSHPIRLIPAQRRPPLPQPTLQPAAGTTSQKLAPQRRQRRRVPHRPPPPAANSAHQSKPMHVGPDPPPRAALRKFPWWHHTPGTATIKPTAGENGGSEAERLSRFHGGGSLCSSRRRVPFGVFWRKCRRRWLPHSVVRGSQAVAAAVMPAAVVSGHCRRDGRQGRGASMPTQEPPLCLS